MSAQDAFRLASHLKGTDRTCVLSKWLSRLIRLGTPSTGTLLTNLASAPWELGQISTLIGLPDWRSIRVSNDVADFTPETLGISCVEFEFPESVRFPTLPVRTSMAQHQTLFDEGYCSVHLFRE